MEDRGVGGLLHVGEVPDEGAAVLGASDDVAAAVGGPRERVDGLAVADELGDGDARGADVEDGHAVRVALERRKEVAVLLVPRDAQQRDEVWTLVDDGAVCERAQVEHAHTAVGAHRRKHVGALRKRNVKDLLVVGNQPRLGLPGRHAPDCADRVERRCPQNVLVLCVPVKRRQRRTRVQRRALRVRERAL